MEELHKKWEKIHHRLQALEAADQEQEAEILKKLMSVCYVPIRNPEL